MIINPYMFGGIPYNTGLVDFYKGNSTPDDSFGTNNLTLVGGTTYTTGLVGNAFSFDGVNDYATATNNIWNFTGNFSLSFWIYLPSSVASTYIASAFTHSGSAKGWLIFQNLTSIKLQYYNSGTLKESAYITTTINTWYHIVLVKKASGNFETYKNNGTAAVTVDTGNPNYGTNYASVGALVDEAFPTGLGFTPMRFQYFRIYNTALTSTDVSNLYNSGTPI